jgi:hypothetical protein
MQRLARTPWFRNSLTPDDWTVVAELEDQGVSVGGFAPTPHGPFTARVRDAFGNGRYGIGSSAGEALRRAVDAWKDAAA